MPTPQRRLCKSNLARNPIADTELQRRQNRRCEDFTFALLARLLIRPEERGLAALLGNFTVRSNHASLQLWIDQQIASLVTCDRVDALDVLELRLRTLLANFGYSD